MPSAAHCCPDEIPCCTLQLALARRPTLVCCRTCHALKPTEPSAVQKIRTVRHEPEGVARRCVSEMKTVVGDSGHLRRPHRGEEPPDDRMNTKTFAGNSAYCIFNPCIFSSAAGEGSPLARAPLVQNPTVPFSRPPGTAITGRHGGHRGGHRRDPGSGADGLREKQGGRAEKTVTLRCRLRRTGNIYLLP
jgi:hypothetical protein